MNRVRILVVDDEKGLRDMLRWELESQGYLVDEAGDGASALALIESDVYDVVVSDVCMPGMTGIEMLRGVRAAWVDTEVIISTGHASLDTAVECLRAGAFDFLQKPFQICELTRAVDRALERRRLYAQTSLYQTSELIFDGAADGCKLAERIVDVARVVMRADAASLDLRDERGAMTRLHASGAVEERPPGAPPDEHRIVHEISSGGHSLGVLTLVRSPARPPFRHDDYERSSVLASQILLALQNALLVRKMISAERLASIGQLAAGVAHEINNPISYVVFAHDFLRDCVARFPDLTPDTVEQMKQALEDAVDGASRIQAIARDLRSLSRSDEASERERVDVRSVVSAAVRIAGAEVRAARAAVDVDIESGLMVSAIAGRLSQVFLNFIVNAAQAMGDRKTGSNEIAVRGRRDGDHVLIEVIDNGPGIPSEHAARLFEAFFTTKGDGKGTGLGLWLSREIVRGFGGDVSVTTSPGRGATFTVTLPAAVDAHVAAAAA